MYIYFEIFFDPKLLLLLFPVIEFTISASYYLAAIRLKHVKYITVTRTICNFCPLTITKDLF